MSLPSSADSAERGPQISVQGTHACEMSSNHSTCYEENLPALWGGVSGCSPVSQLGQDSGCALFDRHSEMARAPVRICSGMIYKRSGLGMYPILIISHQDQIGF